MKRKWPAALSLVGLGLLSVCFSYFLLLPDMHAVRENDCNGAYPMPEGQGTFNLDQLPVSAIAPFPVGLSCTWLREDGSEVIEYHGDWATSVALYGGMVVAAAGLLVAIVPLKSKRSVRAQRAS